MILDEAHAANALVLASLKKENVPAIAPPESAKDPYMGQGSHPEIVERIWDKLGETLPADARCLLYGRPALVHPGSGVVLAVAYGTTYCVRIPREKAQKAIDAGAKITMKFADTGTTNIQEEFGADWVFGAWLKQEETWLLTMYEKWSRNDGRSRRPCARI